MTLRWLCLGALMLALTGCSGEPVANSDGPAPQPVGVPPSGPDGAGKGGGMMVNIPQGEVILDRYKEKSLCIIATPSLDQPAYRQSIKDAEAIAKVAEAKGLVVVEVIDGKMGSVRGGSVLDQVSLSRVVDKHVADKAVIAVVVVDKEGNETAKQTGDEVNVKGLLESL